MRALLVEMIGGGESVFTEEQTKEVDAMIAHVIGVCENLARSENTCHHPICMFRAVQDRMVSAIIDKHGRQHIDMFKNLDGKLH